MKKPRWDTHEKEQPLIDWNDTHRRLETLQLELQRGLTPTPEEKKSTLKARARALAQEPIEKAALEGSIEVVEFLLAYETYGIESSYVREVYHLKEITPLPDTPPFVLGIINVRGQIVSVIDVKKLFDLPERGLTDLNKVIIVRSKEMELGIIADSIRGVRSVLATDIQSPLPTLTGIRADYLKGVTSDRLVILDAVRILSDRRIVVLDEVEREAEGTME